MPETPAPYLHGHHDSVLRSHRWRTVDNSAGYLRPTIDTLSPGAQVLDVGCGPGTITIGLAALVGDGRVVGIDAAPDVVADARSEARRRGQGNVNFEVGDVYHLAFDDDTFDVVTPTRCCNTSPTRSLPWWRCAGSAVPMGWWPPGMPTTGGMFWFPEEPAMAQWQALYQHTARALGGEPDAGRRLLQWARLAGFTDIATSASSWCFATPEDRSWWGGLWADRVTQSSFADHAISHGLAEQDGLDRLAHAWRRWASSDDGWFLVPHGEILCRG